jgi:hypothetical protein
MSPKDTLDFDTEDDIIELTDIVEKGTPPAADEAADDLFGAADGDIDFEKELEDLFSGDDSSDQKKPGKASDGLDFESDLDDLLGGLDGEDKPAAASSSASTDDDFSAELDDLLNSQGSSAPASGINDDDFDADLDALLGDLDTPDTPAAASARTSAEDDLLSELGLAPEALSKPAPKAAPVAAENTGASGDIDFSELDALIEDMEVPKSGKPAAPHEDDGLPDLSDLDALLDEAAAGEAVLTSPATGNNTDDSDDDGVEDLDALLDSLDGAEMTPESPAGNDDDDLDLDKLLAEAEAANAPHAQELQPAGDADDIDSLLADLDAVPAPPPAAPAAPLAFDPNETLDSPDMGELDALLDSLGGASDEDDALPLAAEADDIPELDDILGETMQPEGAAGDAAPAFEEADIDDLDALLAGTGDGPALTSELDDLLNADEPAAEAEPETDDLLQDITGGETVAEMVQDTPEQPELSEITGEPALTDDASADESSTDESDIGESGIGENDIDGSGIGESDIDALLGDDLPQEADIDALLQEVEELPAEEAAGAAAMDIADNLMGDIGDTAEETELDMTSLDEALAEASECVVQEAPDLAALAMRIAAIERMLSPSEEHVEDIVARKIAEAAAEDEARIQQDSPSAIMTALEEALAEDGPIMARIITMIDERIDERLGEMERSVFTHKDWTDNSRELKEEMKANIERAAAKAAADIIREELANLISEE